MGGRSGVRVMFVHGAGLNDIRSGEFPAQCTVVTRACYLAKVLTLRLLAHIRLDLSKSSGRMHSTSVFHGCRAPSVPT